MKSFKEYVVVSSEDFEPKSFPSFSDYISHYMKIGWQPIGGVTVLPRSAIGGGFGCVFYQAMVK